MPAWHHDWVCQTDGCQPQLRPAVVLVLSEAFIHNAYPMEELQLLLKRRLKQDSNSVLVPVFYDVEWQDVRDKVTEYKAAAAAATTAAEKQRLDAFWKGMEDMAHITGIRTDQVNRMQRRTQLRPDPGAGCW
jgi:hypothetical protein